MIVLVMVEVSILGLDLELQSRIVGVDLVESIDKTSTIDRARREDSETPLIALILIRLLQAKISSNS